MIERAQSKNNHSLVKVNGRYVCSSIDPIKEAQDWVSKILKRVVGMKTIFVLGAGAGYHVAELKKATKGATVIVIDFEDELFKFCAATHSIDWAEIKSVCVSESHRLSDNSLVRDAIQDSYAVVKFAPATMAAATNFSDVELFLLGRTWAGFQFLTSTRSRFNNVFKNNVHALPVDSNSLLSIKSLCERLSPEECRESMLLKALRELVV